MAYQPSTSAMPAAPLKPAPAVPEGHPLRHLFQRLTEASFEQAGHRDPELMGYVAGLLVDFTHTDNLYRVRDEQGKRLEYLVDMLLESQRGDAAHTRATQKHLGDYAMFMVGMFPENLTRRRRSMGAHYYVAQGKRAYVTVAEMDAPRPSAALFRKLAAHFEVCVNALHIEKEFLHDEFYQYLIRQILV